MYISPTKIIVCKVSGGGGSVLDNERDIQEPYAKKPECVIQLEMRSSVRWICARGMSRSIPFKDRVIGFSVMNAKDEVM